MAPSGPHEASVRRCRISTVHTAALCPARGWISMGPLMGPRWPFIDHLAPEHGAHTWQVCMTTCLRQNKRHFVELLEINFLFASIQH